MRVARSENSFGRPLDPSAHGHTYALELVTHGCNTHAISQGRPVLTGLRSTDTFSDMIVCVAAEAGLPWYFASYRLQMPGSTCWPTRISTHGPRDPRSTMGWDPRWDPQALQTLVIDLVLSSPDCFRDSRFSIVDANRLAKLMTKDGRTPGDCGLQTEGLITGPRLLVTGRMRVIMPDGFQEGELRAGAWRSWLERT